MDIASIEMDIASIEKEAVQHLRALIRFDTTNPPGNERSAADYVASVAQDAGLPSMVLDSAPGRGNAVVRLPGSGHGKPIVLLGHLDTVPAEPDHWTHSPWSGALADGCVWGRGAIDSKLTIAVGLTAMLALARGGVRLNRDVILCATASEEMAGPANGAAWLAAHHRELIEGEFVISEHGGFCIDVGGRTYYTIQSAEKGGSNADLVASGAPGHASVPHDNNAIHKLARALTELERHPMPLRVTRTLRAFVETIARDHDANGSTDVAATARELLDPARQVAALARLPVSDGLRRTIDAMLRNTATPTILESGTRRNVIPSRATVQLSGRPLPGVTIEEFTAELRAAAGPTVDVVVRDFVPALEHEIDPRFADAAGRALRRHDPAAMTVPLMMPLGTDAKRLTDLRTSIYGFVPMLHDPALDYMSLCHGHDERSSLRSLVFGVRVIRDLVSELAAAP